MWLPRIGDDFLWRGRNCANRFRVRSGYVDLSTGDMVQIPANIDRYSLMIWSEGDGVRIEPFTGWTMNCGLLVNSVNPMFWWNFEHLASWIHQAFLIEAQGAVCVRVTETIAFSGGPTPDNEMPLVSFGSCCSLRSPTANTYVAHGAGFGGGLAPLNNDWIMACFTNCQWQYASAPFLTVLAMGAPPLVAWSTLNPGVAYQSNVSDVSVPFTLDFFNAIDPGTYPPSITIEPYPG